MIQISYGNKFLLASTFARTILDSCLIIMVPQVSQWNVANDVVEDFDAGLEYGEAERILKSVQRGDSREYLVQ